MVACDKEEDNTAKVGKTSNFFYCYLAGIALDAEHHGNHVRSARSHQSGLHFTTCLPEDSAWLVTDSLAERSLGLRVQWDGDGGYVGNKSMSLKFFEACILDTCLFLQLPNSRIMGHASNPFVVESAETEAFRELEVFRSGI